MLFPHTCSEHYRGRFAPSPSGNLHFGSLIAALASYLDARSQNGLWLLRIEDIDPPREIVGAADNIQRTLEAHGLQWDQHTYYQSQQSQEYEIALDYLAQHNLSYPCVCTRKQIQSQGGHLRQLCSMNQASVEENTTSESLIENPCALRFCNHSPVLEFDDLNLGRVSVPADMASDDFIVKRKDGLYAYHLAVVVSDIHQGINHIVRGADLKDPSACQLALYQALGHTPPAYLHVPVAATKPGFKLSKQNHAPELKPDMALTNLYQALQFLQQPLLESHAYDSCDALLKWAIQHWQTTLIPRQAEVIL